MLLMWWRGGPIKSIYDEYTEDSLVDFKIYWNTKRLMNEAINSVNVPSRLMNWTLPDTVDATDILDIAKTTTMITHPVQVRVYTLTPRYIRYNEDFWIH